MVVAVATPPADADAPPGGKTATSLATLLSRPWPVAVLLVTGCDAKVLVGPGRPSLILARPLPPPPGEDASASRSVAASLLAAGSSADGVVVVVVAVVVVVVGWTVSAGPAAALARKGEAGPAPGRLGEVAPPPPVALGLLSPGAARPSLRRKAAAALSRRGVRGEPVAAVEVAAVRVVGVVAAAVGVAGVVPPPLPTAALGDVGVLGEAGAPPLHRAAPPRMDGLLGGEDVRRR